MSVHEPQAPPATQLGDKKMVAKVLGTRNVLGPSICCHAPIGMAMQVDWQSFSLAMVCVFCVGQQPKRVE